MIKNIFIYYWISITLLKKAKKTKQQSIFCAEIRQISACEIALLRTRLLHRSCNKEVSAT